MPAARLAMLILAGGLAWIATAQSLPSDPRIDPTLLGADRRLTRAMLAGALLLAFAAGAI